MIRPGLTSITFRKKSPGEILSLMERTRLQSIEWGGDAHVPPDDSKNAARVARQTADSGIAISSYGSYSRLDDDSAQFERVMDSAQILGARVIRIWAGREGWNEASPSARDKLIDLMLCRASAAAARDLIIALEYHPNTLTDTRAGAIELMARTQAAGGSLKFYWQPRWDWTTAEIASSLVDVLPRIANLHVFTWSGGARLPLAEGEGIWLSALSALGGRDADALLEFVPGDREDSLVRDADTLCRWSDAINRGARLV